MEKMCYHPWIGLDVDPQGKFKPCCKYNHSLGNSFDEYQSNTELVELREQFLRGEMPDGCSRCWHDEESGLPSKRQLDLQYVLKNKKPNLDQFKILAITFGNSCNLACATCYSHASSTWVVEEKKMNPGKLPIFEHKKFYDDQTYLENIKKISHDIIHLEISGGDPFIAGTKQHLEYLDYIIKNNPRVSEISLHYTTNCTIFPSEKFWERWKYFKKVDIQISIDGIAKHFEYLRWPANWSEVKKNIKKYNNLRKEIKNFQLSISHTVSIFNVYYLPSFLEYCKFSNLPEPYIGMVNEPGLYNIKILPKEIKKELEEKLSRHELKNVIQYMNKDIKHCDFDQTLERIKQLDAHRGQSFSETFVEFNELLRKYKCQI